MVARGLADRGFRTTGFSAVSPVPGSAGCSVDCESAVATETCDGFCVTDEVVDLVILDFFISVGEA